MGPKSNRLKFFSSSVWDGADPREYYRMYMNDPRWIKYMVAFLLVVDTLNTIFDSFITYHFSVLEFGNVEGIYDSKLWAVYTHPLLSVTVSSIVQSFFGWRVKKLTGNNWLAGIIVVLSIAQFLAGIGTTVSVVIVTNFTQYQKFKPIIIVWLVLAPLDDLIIAGSLTWYLVRPFQLVIKKAPVNSVFSM